MKGVYNPLNGTELSLKPASQDSSNSIDDKNNIPITKRFLCILIGLVMIVSFTYIGIYFLTQNKVSKETNLEKTAIPVDWVYYKHDILGISFYYPPEWGEVTTSPKRTITNLEKINELRREDRENPNHISELHYTIYVSFSGERTPRIEIYNDDFEGKLASNGRLMFFGPIDNFLVIKESHNICDYSFEFDKRPIVDWYILKEIYSECEGDIKTSIIQEKSKKENGSIYYTYVLRDYTFFKLKNNYFDNMITDYFYMVKQSPDEILKLEDIFIEAGEDYERKRQDFSLFISSVDVFIPVLPEPKEFEIIENEDPNITTIRRYYYELDCGDLQEAYNMYVDKKFDFKTYQQLYEETILAEPYEFKKIGNNSYQIKVYFQNDNEEKTLYRETLNVDEGGIFVVSSERILTDFLSFGDMTAFIMARDGNSYLVVSKDGKEDILETVATEFSFERSPEKILWGPLKFSPKGNYLINYYSYFESGGIEVYYLKDKKNILTLPLANFDNSNFTEGEDYFFACASNLMHNKYYNVIYSVPDFKEIYRDDFEREDLVVCRYERERDVIRFESSYVPSEGFEKEGYEKGKTKKITEFSLVDKSIREFIE